MWNYRKLSSNDSPMAEILNRCSCKSNIRLVVYHLSENHVECATTPNADREYKLTNDEARAISNDARSGAHAVLAFDVRTKDVYLIDSTPELQVASAVLLCVVTELLNGCVQPRENQYGAPVAARRMPTPPQNVARGENGRFVRQEPRFEEEETFERPAAPTRVLDNGTPLVGHRFRIGRH